MTSSSSQTDYYCWSPATEAQRSALNSRAEILLFGGSAGSLKTETMLMDAVQEYENPNLRAIVFRASFVQMTDIIDKTRRLYAPLGGVFVGPPRYTWTFPSGATIRFAYMKSDDDVWKYLGPRYCVARGTPILMSDGCYRAIEEISIGDMVATMEGPRRVTATHGPFFKECVEAVTDLGSQVHPVDHRVLLQSGAWGSYASLTGDRTCFEESDGCIPGTAQRPALSVRVVLHVQPPRSNAVSPHSPSVSRTSDKSLELSRSKVREHQQCDYSDWRRAPEPVPAGSIGECSQPMPSFSHPYLNRPLQCSEEATVGVCTMRPIGRREVFDLTVHSSNHYITKGIVNSNSFIGFDESTLHTERQVRNIMGRLSTTDTTLRLRVRLTSNPGNVGAAWHRTLFLRGHCPVHNPRESAQPGRLYRDRYWPSDNEPIPFSVAFIPGKLSDHKLLDANYARRLHMMSGGAAAAMEQGCWCSLEGAYFPFLHAGMIKPLAEADVEWWHSHFLSIDYGYGKSSAAAGLYVRGPSEQTNIRYSIPGVRTIDMNAAGNIFPNGRIRKVGELVVPHVPAYEFAQMVVDRFIKPQDGRQRRRIVAAYLDPANYKEIGDGHTIADQINEVLEPWDVVCERASNDRIGGWQLLYRMLRTGEFEITDVCPRSFEALRTRMHDDTRPGDIRKVAGDPLDDVVDECRYALYTFIQQSEKPRELRLAEAVQDIDRSTPAGMTSAVIRYQEAADRIRDEEAPIRLARFRPGRRR